MTTTTDNLDELIKVCERAITAYKGGRHDEKRSKAIFAFRDAFDDPQRCLALLKELKASRQFLAPLTRDEDQPHE